MLKLTSRRMGSIALGFLLVACFSSAWADRVKLKDGRVIEGTVIPQDSGYWVKGADGQTYRFEASQVASIEKGGAGAPSTPSPSPSVPAAPGVPAGPKPAVPGSKTTVVLNFSATKAKCSTIDSALAAVALWQSFIDNAPKTDADLPAAKEELAKWKTLADGGAEKIRGKWVGGEERKAILTKAVALRKEADALLSQNQTLQAMKKLEESANVYPNSMEINYQIGYMAMIQHNEDKAIEWFNKALAIQPETPEAIGNIAAVYCIKRNFDKGIPMMKKALEMRDSKELVQNLITAITSAPDVLRRRKDMKEAEGAARLLASKYNIEGPRESYWILRLHHNDVPRGKDGAGSMWSGTGFILAADGLILTNRHVVEGGKTLMVILAGMGPGGKDLQKAAEVVVIDDEQDLALIRIKPDPAHAFTVMQLSPKDSPGDGADCTVIGYPMIDRLGGNVKITRGIVSSAAKREEGPDVMVDAKVNPGNSGGPILDRLGNVMAIVSMKTIGNGTEDSYGLGISVGMIRKFLKKNDVKLTPGPATGTALTAEEIAAKAKPSTVCILGTNK